MVKDENGFVVEPKIMSQKEIEDYMKNFEEKKLTPKEILEDWRKKNICKEEDYTEMSLKIFYLEKLLENLTIMNKDLITVVKNLSKIVLEK